MTSSYTGNGVNGRQVAGVGFKPDLVWVWTDSQYAVWSSPVISGGKTMYFSNAAAGITTGITGYFNNGFTVGTHATVNSTGITYYYAAFKDNGAGDIKIGRYLGNGGDERVITGVGFKPDFVHIKGDTTQGGVYHFSG